MTYTVLCAKLNQNLSGLAHPPFPGALGKKIYESISQQAWDMWLSHQTMLINEYRLSLIDVKAREFLREELEKYFFGEGSTLPEGYAPKE